MNTRSTYVKAVSVVVSDTRLGQLGGARLQPHRAVNLAGSSRSCGGALVINSNSHSPIHSQVSSWDYPPLDIVASLCPDSGRSNLTHPNYDRNRPGSGEKTFPISTPTRRGGDSQQCASLRFPQITTLKKQEGVE